ncbi:hypothetical protein MKEN_00932000 [Mycena kentingensis (nom. inval.)]|nr:hypothetical protein MKEN_00932000 [Mycena kentingensis (nom. inval.)]
MPPDSSLPSARVHAPSTRLDEIANKLGSIVQVIDVLYDGLQTPFLQGISLTMRSVLDGVQHVKMNKTECIALLEAVNEVLCAVIALHLECEPGTLGPGQLMELGRFVKTLHTVFSLLETQRETSRIKRFFKQGEVSTMLKACRADVNNILESLKLQSVSLAATLQDVEADLSLAHEKILEIIQTESDGASFSTGAFSHGSSMSVFSLIPPSPKIFYGRDAEIAHTVNVLTKNETSAQVILGPGGIGKTSLAQAILHHPEIQAKYPPNCCVYASCDNAFNAHDILMLVAMLLGLTPAGRNPRADIAAHLKNKAVPHFVVLDNLETVWEPVDLRSDIEAVLGFLAGIQNVSLLVTMRGAERPGGVPWTRPFLPPLAPLEDQAARLTLLDITDESDMLDSEISSVLALTDNIPLAITLIAHLLQSEGAKGVLARWEEHKTALLSDGLDKRTNLDMSIAISLTSPRMVANPEAHELLRMLSVLPDGLADADFNTSTLPIANVLQCKTTLLRTSLAYITPSKRINLLAPIREYIRAQQPPSVDLVRPIFRAYLQLLELFNDFYGISPVGSLRARIAANFGNIQTLLVFRISGAVSPDEASEIISCGLLANMFSRLEGGGEASFIDSATVHYSKLFGAGTECLQVRFIIEQLWLYRYRAIPNGPELIERAINLFPRFDDAKIKSELLLCASTFAYLSQNNFTLAQSWAEKALAAAAPDSRMRGNCLRKLASLHSNRGEFRSCVEVATTAQRVFRQNGDLFETSHAGVPNWLGLACPRQEPRHFGLGFDGLGHWLAPAWGR